MIIMFHNTPCRQVHHETLDKFDARLAPFLQKQPAWYLGLAKVLQNKYGQFCKQFFSEDGQVTQFKYLQNRNTFASGSAHGGSARDQPVHVRAALCGQGGGKPRHRPPGVRSRGRLQVSHIHVIRIL